mgnify:CR=1 FL=1
MTKVLVALLLLGLVPLQDVVEAVGVDVDVATLAAAADGVLGEDVLFALASPEDHLGSAYLVAIEVVGTVFDVAVHYAQRVAHVPAVHNHQDREGFVPQPHQTQALVLGVGVMDGRFEDSLHLVLGERVGAFACVVLPLVLLGNALQEIEDARVVLVVEVVQRRAFYKLFS